MFGRHGVPEYTCGVQDFLTLKATNIESSGMKQYFEKCASISLDRQVGSRYFVTAANACKIIFLKDAATNFLLFSDKKDRGNRLEKDLFSKLQDPLKLAALRADGLMYFHVYSDLVMLSKSTQLGKSALDMNLHYLELKLFFSEMQSDIDCVFDKTLEVFKSEKRLYGNSKEINHRLHKCMSTITDHLFTIPEYKKGILKELLVAGASTMLEKLCSYAQNQLPGGKYWAPEKAIRDVLRQLKPSNDVCESVLGLNDYICIRLDVQI